MVNSHSVFFKISFGVIALHGVLLLWALLSLQRTIISIPTPPLVVKTISLQPIEHHKPFKKETLKPDPKPKITPKTDPKPKALTKKSTPKPQKNTAKKPSKMDHLLAQAKSTLDKIDQPQEQKKALSLPLPKLTKTKEMLSVKETSYQDKLAWLLKELLKLPEYGMVSLELKLDRSGKVKKLNVLKSENERNKIYLETTIWELTFPAFGNYFSGEMDHTFFIELQNDL